jgi:hypothetical protein
MNLGGEPEKKALEEYGVDLTERARDGESITGISKAHIPFYFKIYFDMPVSPC